MAWKPRNAVQRPQKKKQMRIIIINSANDNKEEMHKCIMFLQILRIKFNL